MEDGEERLVEELAARRSSLDKTQTTTDAQESPLLPKGQVPEASCSVRLSEKDEAAILAAADQPPTPNEAAVRAARRFIQRHG